MKKIGIIGGLSAESTIEYYKILIKEYNKRKGGKSSPLLIIDSLDLEEAVNLMSNNDWDGVFNIIFQSAKNLEHAGAEVIIIATNSIHKIFDRLQEEINTPMISILDVTAEAVKSKNLKKIGLLGTIFTMQSDFFHKAFQRYNLEIIVPNRDDQELVNEIIFNELTFHIIKPESKRGYLEVIGRLQQEEAEGVILGCTEIPLLIKQEDSPIPVFDTTTLHAMAALEYAMK
ncbi:MAG: aspartate/glutamate racemase family protein [Candidatus Heimdallarchaeota archaeon]|nr:aspartate/glutamate racemase family protein [Candidatus Heimdallarchaeota archaeon]